NMKYIILLLGLLFNINPVQAQQSTISFSNAIYNWNHLSIDSTKIDLDNNDGKNHLFYFSEDHSFINGKYLYNVSVDANNSVSGAFIEKIDVENGSSIWKNFYDLSNFDENEYPSTISLNNQGNLEIVGYRNTLDEFPVFWYEALPVYREYDTNNGSLLQYDTIDKSDTLAEKLFTLYERFKLNLVNENYVQSYYVSDESGLKDIYVINDYYNFAGHYLYSDSIVPITFTDQIRVSNKKKSDNGQVILSRAFEDGSTVVESLLTVTDDKLTILTQIDISDFIQSPDEAYITKIYNDKIEVVSEFHYSSAADMEMTINYFDLEGNHLNQYKIPRTLNYSIRTHILPNEEPLIAVSRPMLEDQSQGEIVFYSTNSDNNLVVVKKLLVEDSHAFVINKVMSDIDDNILLLGKYSPIVSSEGSLASTEFETVLLSFNQSELGILTSVKELKETIVFNIFPNPVSESINISINSIKRLGNLTYQIIDSNGKLAQIGKFTDNINISKLTIGNYILRILSNNNELGSKKMIKVN
ncbi:MAG: T9SS type A sorting domain-containing protein, partial [Saprospiraceae bacterium]